MIIEICLIIMTVIQVAVIVSLLVIFFKAKSSVKELHADLKKSSAEVAVLINKTTELVSDLSAKSKSINCLFESLPFLKAKSDFSPLHFEAEEPKKTIPRIVEWISTGVVLIKLAKELVKNGK